ncbi:MAG: zinc-ribbon domain-containing protein [Firmicutes bacterium]|nr:zinc-ribbon domain-containing protein [Bacillota bacterium]
MYCKNCGEKITKDSKFCKKCGASVLEKETHEMSEEQKLAYYRKRKKESYIYVFLGIFLIMIPICVIILFAIVGAFHEPLYGTWNCEGSIIELDSDDHFKLTESEEPYESITGKYQKEWDYSLSKEQTTYELELIPDSEFQSVKFEAIIQDETEDEMSLKMVNSEYPMSCVRMND